MIYDPGVDVLFIELCEAEPTSNFDYEASVTEVVDVEGRFIALELLDVRERLTVEEMNGLTTVS